MAPEPGPSAAVPKFPVAARRRYPLYGYVVATLVTQLGTAMSGLAIPWLVLVTTGSAAKTGLVGFCEMGPYVVMQALSGPLADRIGIRRATVIGNSVAALLVGAIPLLYALGHLDIGPLVALVAVAGAVRGTADAASGPLVPRTAAFGQVANERAAGLSSGATRLGLLIGLPLAGGLISLTNPATVVLIDAATFGLAALIIFAMVPAAVAAPSAEELGAGDPGGAEGGAEKFTLSSYRAQLAEGIRFLVADRVIGGIALMVAITNLFDQSFSTVLVPVWVRSRLHHVAGLGLIGGAGAVGSVLGVLVGTWLGPRLPRRWSYAVGFLLGASPPFAALAFSASLAPVLIASAIAGLVTGGINPIIGAVAFERIPADLQTRVLGAFKASAWIGIPFGSLAGGALTEAIGLKKTLLLMGGAMLVTTLAPFVFPSWRGMNKAPVAGTRPGKDGSSPADVLGGDSASLCD